MHVSPAAYERSMVRSSLRDRTLIATASLTEAYPNQLAKMLGIDTYRLESVMEGRVSDGYSEALSLVRLGLVEIRQTALGKVYAITRKGARKARQLTARKVRRARAREANRSVRFAPRVTPQPGITTDTGDPSPVAPAPVAPPETRSFRWAIEG